MSEQQIYEGIVKMQKELSKKTGIEFDKTEIEIKKLKRQAELYKTSLDESREVVSDYKSRIEKAVEYINYFGTTPEQNDNTTCRSILKSLLNILNGKE